MAKALRNRDGINIKPLQSFLFNEADNKVRIVKTVKSINQLMLETVNWSRKAT